MFSLQPDFVDVKTDVTPDERLAISAPVGDLSHFRVKNIRPDVAKIQAALNRFPVRDGGPQPTLKFDSVVGPLTIAAIKRFQTLNQLKSRDGIVDGITIVLLRAGPDVAGTHGSIHWNCVIVLGGSGGPGFRRDDGCGGAG